MTALSWDDIIIFLIPSLQNKPLHCCNGLWYNPGRTDTLISAVSIQTYEWKCIVKNKKKYIDVISFQETYDITVICMRLRLVLFWLLFLCLLTWLHIAESNLCENEKKKISIKVVAWFCICCKLKKKNTKWRKKKMKNVLRQLLQNWTHFCFLSCTKMLSLATMHIVIIHRGWSSSLTHSAIL